MFSPEITPSSSANPIQQWVQQHPLLTYFVLAFFGTWLFFSPLTLSQRGLALLPIELSDGFAFLCYFLATYTGPFLAAFVVTGIIEGRGGVRKLLKRIVQWRIGLRWYLILLIGYPAVLLLGVAVLDGNVALDSFVTNWPLLWTLYLPSILFGIFFPSLGEETGWRGFAAPRMQAAYGPVPGTLMLGLIHALWHLPAYPVRGLFTEVGWDTTTFVANSLAIITATIVWTWLFNNAHSSIFYAILIHATSNATSSLVPQWLATTTNDPWALAKIFGLVALLLILWTRGRLGYEQPQTEPRITPQPFQSSIRSV